MKVVIAAAGQGVRMLHLTKNKSKHLINVFKKPFLAYLLDNLRKAGYKEIILVVGYRADLMEKFLKEYNYKATLVNQFEILGGREKEYGTLCPIKCVKDIVGKENFLAIYGDNFFSTKTLKAFNINDNYNYIGASFHPHPEKYGVLIEENGFLKEIVEKPTRLKTDLDGGGRRSDTSERQSQYGSRENRLRANILINAGIYKFTPEIFAKIPQVSLSPRGEYELTDAVNLLAKEKKVKIKKIPDKRFELGNPADIIRFARFLKGENAGAKELF